MYFAQALEEAITILERQARSHGSNHAIIADDYVGENLPNDPSPTRRRIFDLLPALRGLPTDEYPCIKGPADIDRLLRSRIAYNDQEHFVCVMLDTKNRVLSSPTIFIGTTSSCVVDPKIILRAALEAGATGIIAAHNHPSGDTSPSLDDRRQTKRLSEGAELLNITLLDHVIIGRGWLSMKEAGYFS